MHTILVLLGSASLLVTALGVLSAKSDIQLILAMLGVIGGILGFGLGAIISRMDTLAKQTPAKFEP